ncbi:amidohydrolase family protein [Pseudobacteroides cellulosolvens]|uniref:Amidohydrolase n=1 Tax=Pseudobacteroides cellulosolvens ATCC 35603 = DSM 2933 TaxID=398512 RepID=A0A0L6JX81_9FIRM|nr:amidohydrolase family protein [Pseudobacteroides cellulosolvens]KNY30344.1 amidohydrolase [Pseudobacteroides cellulosolvens ATCC 35603 = DSM 2933]
MVLRFLTRFMLIILVIILLLGIPGYVYYTLTLYKPKTVQKGYLALTRASVLVGENLNSFMDSTILIKDGVIVKVGNSSDITIPEGAATLDMNGCTVMPGLIDMHVHLSSYEHQVNKVLNFLSMPKMLADLVRFTPDKRQALLKNGVTSVCSLGDEYKWIMDLKKQIRDGVLEGPRIFAAGPVFTIPGSHTTDVLGADPESVRLPSTPEEAQRMVRELAHNDEPIDLIKVVQDRGDRQHALHPVAHDILHAIVNEAHNHSLPVVARWGTEEDLQDVLDAGVDSLQHLEDHTGDINNLWPDNILKLILNHNMPRIVVGTYAGMPGAFFGDGIHHEMEKLVESGLTPREALKAATSGAAKVLRTDYIGTIGVGQVADLIVIDGNPLKNIKDTRNIVMVLRDGRIVVDQL